MRDMAYYTKHYKRYKNAIPKVRYLIEETELRLYAIRIIANSLLVGGHSEELTLVRYLENKRAALLLQLGRIEGIISVVDAFLVPYKRVMNHLFETWRIKL